MTKQLAVVSLSGGMDSSTALALMLDADYEALAISFNYGQRHHRELLAAVDVAAHYGVDHHIIDLKSVGALLSGSALTDSSVPVPEGHYEAETMKATVVPNRNAIMANILIGIASARKAECVVLGVHAGDHAVYPDCRPVFINDLRVLAASALEGFHIPEIVTPFLYASKADIAREARRRKVPLELTWSCYQGRDVHCGRCGTCIERREALKLADVEDPTQYLDMDYAWTVLA
jgi:7-cyano-7-deazaguanine synthase